MGEHLVGDGPGLGRGGASDHVETDPEAQLPTLVGGQLAHPVEALGHHRRRLAPGQVDVDVTCGDLLGCW